MAASQRVARQALSRVRSTATRPVPAKSLCSTFRCTYYHAPTRPLRPLPSLRTPFTSTLSQSIRRESSASLPSKVYNFEQVKKFAAEPSPGRILIDVREPSEYEAGYIPTAINIPVKTSPDALFLSEEEFSDRFDFEKPSLKDEVVFYCRSGVRSGAAATFAKQVGYENVAEYKGSWLDWEKNGGEAAKPGQK